MTYQEQETFYRRALHALRQGLLTEASNMFRELADECEHDARFLSYRGLLLAIRERRMSEGVAMCKQAISLAPADPEAHLNLMRIYKSTGRRQSAVTVLRDAIRRGVKHKSVMREIEILSPRRRPPLASLPRDHRVNKLLAKIQARFRRTRTEPGPPVRARSRTAAA